MKINSYSLALSILNELKRNGMRESIFNFDSTFTKEELNSINELNITGCDSLEGIENLEKIKTLRLLGTNLDTFSNYLSLNNITDFSGIKSLKSLENLIIWHDNNIKLLDITGLNLKKLTLISNPNLTEIKGIDGMKSLEKVYVVGSKIVLMGNPTKYLVSTKNAKENILDLKMYNPLFSENRIGKKLTSKETNIRFAEQLHFYDEVYCLSLEQIRELNRLGINILASLNLNGKQDYEKSYEVYKYIINSVEYDNENLEYREKNYNISKEDREKMRMLFINSSLSALKNKKTVCDGYVNAIIYLLSLLNIKALPVICQNKDGMAHTAIKILIDNEWIYADPERDSSAKKIKYFNLTREELTKVYRLAPNEYMDYLDGGTYVKHFV